MSVFNFGRGMVFDLLDLEDENFLITRDNVPSMLADLKTLGGRDSLLKNHMCPDHRRLGQDLHPPVPADRRQPPP